LNYVDIYYKLGPVLVVSILSAANGSHLPFAVGLLLGRYILNRVMNQLS
jgi:hypothetical protein